MSLEQNAENLLSVDESCIELLCESGCVTLQERDWNINRQNQVIKFNFCTDFISFFLVYINFIRYDYTTPYFIRMHYYNVDFINARDYIFVLHAFCVHL